MNSQNILGVERKIELHALSDPEEVIGAIEVVPEVGGCAVKSTICTSKVDSSQKFVRSHFGKVRLPLFGARVKIAAHTAALKAEVKSDM